MQVQRNMLMRNFILLRCVAVTALGACMLCMLLLFTCAASSKHSSINSKNVREAEADSLFAAGNFEGAKMAYEKIRIEMPPSSPEAEKAHYYLGYINVFYKNPWADWNTALTEFKSFAALYPNDPRINEVLSWIRILTTIKSFESEYRRATNKVELLAQDSSTAFEIKRFYLDSMAAILRNSYESRDSVVRKHDSLARKNAELINVIIDLEKKFQRAGK